MIAYHLQPPPAQRAGGLEAAIQGLMGALERAGVTVRDQLPEQLEPDSLVHLHGLWQRRYLAAARQCRTQGRPYLVSPHGMLEPWAWRHKAWKKWPYYFLFEKSLLRGAAALLATAEQEAQNLRSLLPGQRVETLPLGLTGSARPDYHAARAELGWSPEDRVLLFLSRLHVKKGLELLLEALTHTPHTSRTRLVIVGDGAPEYVRGLHAWAAARVTRLPRLDWIGPVWGEARWRYFQGADLFCLPSYSENFGLAVLEALQVGTPVLTTRTTPWGSTLPASAGLICDPEVRSVQDALAAFLGGPESRREERAALADWTHQHYAWDRLAQEYLLLYQSLTRR